MRPLIASLTLILLTACSSSSEKLTPEAVDTLNEFADAAAKMPKCSDVWIVGKQLPKDYEGCKEGTTIVAAISTCAGSVTTYETPGHGFFTDRSGTIRDGGVDYASSPDYAAALDGC